MPPFDWHETFRTKYDCLTFGYEESLRKMKEIGREDVNKYGMYIKFYCTPIETIQPLQFPCTYSCRSKGSRATPTLVKVIA